MSDPTVFWQEIRGSLMVRGTGWKPVIETLPAHINRAEVKELWQSPEQLTVLTGKGHIAGGIIESAPNHDTILPFLVPNQAGSALGSGEDYTLENLSLQWLYRFVIVEALIEHNHKEPMAKWAPMFLHTVDQGLQFMLYIATLLVLVEEGRDINRVGGEESLEQLVKSRVQQACEFLHPKAQDYGESFRRHGLPGLLPRLWDKIARYAQLKADNRVGNFEKKEDSARDLLGYCCIAYSLMLELPQEVRQGFQPVAVYQTESNVMEGAEWKKVK